MGEQRLLFFVFFLFLINIHLYRGPCSQAFLAGRREGSAELDRCIVDNIKWASE